MPRPARAVAAFLTLQLVLPFAPTPSRRPQLRLRSESDGRLVAVKAKEADLRAQLAKIQREKADVLSNRTLEIGIVGFGRFGQFLATKFASYGHEIHGLSLSDRSGEARDCGAKGCGRLDATEDVDAFFARKPDVVVLACSIVSFEETLLRIKPALEKHPDTLFVDVLSVKEHAKDALLKNLPSTTGVLCTHPMFGPESGRHGWEDLAFVYDKVRIPDDESDACERFLSLFESAGCRMVEMSCTQHDVYAANSQFLTHLVGRMLGGVGDLRSTPIDTKGFASILRVVETTCDDSFDLFSGLYRYNVHSKSTLLCLRKAMADIELRLISSELDGGKVDGEARGTLDYLDVRERVWNENGAEWSGRTP